MDDFSEQKVEAQQVRPKSNWPAIVGGVVAAVALLAVMGVVAWQMGWLSALNPFSGWATPIETSIEPNASSGDTLPRNYGWSYGGREWSLNMEIPEYLYLYYSRMERAPVEDYSIYVTHPKDDDEVIEPLAAELERLALQRGYDAEETVNFVASFVQSLAYTYDANGEYPKYPVETLIDKGGDCEDTAILAAALLQVMDYDTVLIRFSPPIESEAGHMAVGVAVAGASGDYYRYDGKNYYYLETTDSWPVGVMPDQIRAEYKQAEAIYELTRAPVLHFTEYAWRVNDRWFGSDTIDLEVTITNWGTADADAFYVRAFFEGYESSAKSSATYDLAYGYQISGVATKGILVPSGGGTLCVELFEDGVKVDDWSQYIS